jgi:Ca-activated chloride channel family protein
MPAELPDLFDGDQIILLGQYRGDAPLQFRLSGTHEGRVHEYGFRFSLAGASTRNAFVPRLWASRRIAYLADQVRQAGAAGPVPRAAANDPFLDPKLRELRDEILRLSTEFGVLSEYTAFLATEGTRLSDWGAMTATCQGELGGKAMQTRSGVFALNQAWNIQSQKGQATLNRRNGYIDQRLERVETSNVLQVCDRAFFREGARWVDSRIVLDGDLTAHETVAFGSQAHRGLLERLEAKGQQAALSIGDQILLRDGDRNVLVTNDRK